MEASERDEYILKAQQEGTGYWGRMHSKSPGGSSSASGAIATYGEPTEEVSKALDSLDELMLEYEK